MDVPRDVPELPGREETGDFGDWQLPTEEGGPLTFTGTYLGVGSSRRGGHNHAPESPPPGGKCAACRWTEVRLYRVEPEPAPEGGDHYLVHVTGRSKLPGEVDFYKVEHVDDVEGIFKVLTIRGRGRAHLGHVGTQVLERAADLDDRILAVYREVARAVS